MEDFMLKTFSWFNEMSEGTENKLLFGGRGRGEDEIGYWIASNSKQEVDDLSLFVQRYIFDIIFGIGL